MAVHAVNSVEGCQKDHFRGFQLFYILNHANRGLVSAQLPLEAQMETILCHYTQEPSLSLILCTVYKTSWIVMYIYNMSVHHVPLYL